MFYELERFDLCSLYLVLCLLAKTDRFSSLQRQSEYKTKNKDQSTKNKVQGLCHSLVAGQFTRSRAQVLRQRFSEVYTVHNADYGRFDGHILIADCRPCGLAKSA